MPRSSSSRLSIAALSYKYSLFAALLVPLVATTASRADLYVADNDVVDRFDSSTGAVVQTNGQNTFASLIGDTGITVGPDGLVYVGTSNPGSDPNLAVVNRYNAATGAGRRGVHSLCQRPSQLSNIQGIAFGPDQNFYAADEGDNGPVKSFNSTGGYLATYATQGGNAEAVAFNPADPNDGYVATGGTIEKFNLTTKSDNILIQGRQRYVQQRQRPGLRAGWQAIRSGYLQRRPRILQYNANGTGQTVFADFNSSEFASEVFQPSDLAFGPNGDLYVSGLNEESLSSQQGEILQISADGDFLQRLRHEPQRTRLPGIHASSRTRVALNPCRRIGNLSAAGQNAPPLIRPTFLGIGVSSRISESELTAEHAEIAETDAKKRGPNNSLDA